jgi:hypothetical protein
MAKSINKMSFDDAFKTKRRELGPGKTFTWQGEKYTTDKKDDSMDDLTSFGNLPSPEDNVTEGGPTQRNTPRNPPKGAKDPAPMTRVDMGGVSFGDPDMTREEQESIAKNLLKGAAAIGGGPAVRGVQTANRQRIIGRNYENMSERQQRMAANAANMVARPVQTRTGMKSGGSTGRGGGCEIRGKTKGRMI